MTNFRAGTNGTLSPVGTGADLNYYTATFTTKLPTSAKMVTAAMGYGAMYQTNVPGYEATVPVGCATAPCTYGLNVAAQDVKLVATGYTPRRITTETERCNLCHEKLGIFAESVFHSGQRNDPTMCAMCHNPNRSSSGWSADSTAFVHGIHAGQKRSVPYVWHSTTGLLVDGITPARTSSFSTIRFPGGVAHLKQCTACHAPGGYDFSAGAAQVGNRLYRTAATGTMATAGTQNALSLSPYVTAGATYGSGYSSSNAAATAPTQAGTGATLVNSPISNACFACHDRRHGLAAGLDDQVPLRVGRRLDLPCAWGEGRCGQRRYPRWCGARQLRAVPGLSWSRRHRADQDRPWRGVI